MSDIKFTDEQKSVIKARNSNLLVSAAAGSGKTAVLVERIIDRLTDKENPVSLDRLLVMTFTRAAAEGMKQKIGAALEERISRCQEALDREEPGSSAWEDAYALWTDLKAQQAMLPRARISTIDSVFQGLIRQYFQYLDIDPSFRVADEGELKLLKADIIGQLLEEKYEEADPGFLRFSQAFSGTGLDEKLSDLILRAYDFVSSQPWPEDFLLGCEQDAAREESGRVWETDWFSVCMEEVKEEVFRIHTLLQEEKEKAQQPDGWKPYLENLEAAETLYATLGNIPGRLQGKEAYDEIRSQLQSYVTLPLSRKGCKEGSPEKKSSARRVLEIANTYAGKLRGRQFSLSSDEMELAAGGSAADIRQLIALTLCFLERFTRKKRERSIVDFVDMEHLALKLLYTKEGDTCHYSALADDLAHDFDEILIDEYQDSNEVQEQLIRALSAERFGRPNVFMVGDVKQSIYSFRRARPELFMEKYHSYPEYDGRQRQPGVRIELNRNFRSRSEVLDTVNEVFACVMQPQAGGIRYDEKAALYPGRTEVRTPAYKTELLVAETKGVQLSGDELEAVMIAKRIQELKTPGVEATGTNDIQPPVFQNRDITILVRSKGKAQRMAEILRQFGIEAVFDSSTGYFSSVEITLMLSLLSVINNPCQDIPLAAVLKSIIGDFSDEDLSLMKIRFGKDEGGRDLSLYDTLEAAEKYTGDALGIRAAAFMEKLRSWRKLSGHLSVHELIDHLYRETGYYHYASALPEGTKRRRNLDMLLEKAENYTATSYHGLFNFIRYIDQLQSYETETQEAPGTDGEDVVHITTIHKSKGLEYPVTIIAGMNRLFNLQDAREGLVMDERLGFACDYVDTENRVRYPSMKAGLIRDHARLQQIGEELRVLYVAMTRARDKLIMTASVSEYDKKEEEERSSADDVASSTAQLAFLLKSGVQKSSSLAVKVFGPGTLELPEEKEETDSEETTAGVKITENPAEQLAEEVDGQLCFDFNESAWESAGSPESETAAQEAQLKEIERLRANIETPYAHQTETMLSPKVSVSSLKAATLMTTEEMTTAAGEDELKAEQKERKETKGAEYGTIVHRAFEIFDYGKDLPEALPEIAGAGEGTMRSVRRIMEAFLRTNLAQRMKRADAEGNLYRERHFMVGIPACELTPGVSSEELQLMQGIIDAYIIGPDGIELIDYKTDRVNSAEILVQRYALQLKLYARALEQLLRKKVTRCVIYSTVLEKEIEV